MTVPEGIQIAKHHLTLVIPEISENLQLEELETPPFGSKWSFTFSSTPSSVEPVNSLAYLLKSKRITKSVEIDPETGSLLSVKNVAA